MAKRKDTAGSEEVVGAVEVKGSKLSPQGFYEQNQKVVSYIVIGLGVLIALYFGYKYLYIGPREKDALNAMYKAEEQFTKDSFALALENPGGGFEGFISIIDNYSGTKAANLAKYYAGISYLNMGKYEDAINYLNDYSANDDVTKIMKAGALGDASAELGKMDEAEGYYKNAASASDNDMLTPYYLHKLAMLYFSQSKNDQAVAELEKIKADYPDSNEFKDAEKLLARLK
jgi:TolA-binding protein